MRLEQRTAEWIVLLCVLGLASAACRPATAVQAVATDWIAEPVSALPAAPSVDDALWQSARPAYFPLHDGSHGALTADSVELRALYDQAHIAIRARWNGPTLGQAEPLFTLIWHKETLPDQHGETCYAACHNVWSDGAGGIRAVDLSVVPARAEPPMPSRATLTDGVWTATYVRPLRADNPLDVQFVDRSLSYPVRARVWRGTADGPDRLSELYALRFGH